MIALITGKWDLILAVQNPPMKFFNGKVYMYIHYPLITFNKFPVIRVQSHKHLRLTLDSKLNFNGHMSSIWSKVHKLTVVLRKL